MSASSKNRDDRRVAVRTIVRVSRSYHLALAFLLGVAAIPGRRRRVMSANPALADEAPIAVGTELMATSDVTLHTAEIAKGSRVSVTKLSRTAVKSTPSTWRWPTATSSR